MVLVTPTTLRRRLALSFLALAVVVSTLGVLSALSLVALSRATVDRVERYGPALLETETLTRAYSDQETGLRGYLVAGSEDFLSPYTEGRAAERASVAHLRELLALRPDLIERLVAVRAEAHGWQVEVAEPAIARVRAGGSAEVLIADFERGKARFDLVRAALAALRTPVQTTRDAATAELNRQEVRLRYILVFTSMVLVVIAVLTWLGLRRWVTRPLELLGQEVDRVEGGDLHRSVSVANGPVEITTLAGQVDRMRLRILEEYALAEGARLDAQAAQATVEAQAEDLRRSNTELEQFAYVASHDLQEPLRKVASFCQLIEHRYKDQLDDRGVQYIEFAVDGAKRMQQLINDLLAFSRVGRAGTQFAPVDLHRVLAQAERQLELLVTESGAVITHDELPTVEGDQSLLVQLLQNLIGNGIKFRGTEPPRVHLSARPSDEDGRWEIACSDNGIGIEPQYEEKIFVIFQRLHGRDAYGGTGIGLAMCKKIVEAHGGRLWLDTSLRETQDPRGAIFRFTLPTVQSSEQNDTRRRRRDDAAVRG